MIDKKIFYLSTEKALTFDFLNILSTYFANSTMSTFEKNTVWIPIVANNTIF